jgi:hypothetical protein
MLFERSKKKCRKKFEKNIGLYFIWIPSIYWHEFTIDSFQNVAGEGTLVYHGLLTQPSWGWLELTADLEAKYRRFVP